MARTLPRRQRRHRRRNRNHQPRQERRDTAAGLLRPVGGRRRREGVNMTMAAVTRPATRPLPDADVLAFIYLEARLADEGRYSEWGWLWAGEDPVEYRVPLHPDDDPRTTPAYIIDNGRRNRSRVAQLNTRNRHFQVQTSLNRR